MLMKRNAYIKLKAHEFNKNFGKWFPMKNISIKFEFGLNFHSSDLNSIDHFNTCIPKNEKKVTHKQTIQIESN